LNQRKLMGGTSESMLLVLALVASLERKGSLVLTRTNFKIIFVITDLTVVLNFYCLIIKIFLLSFKKTLIS
jgi:hypothetical protein